MNENSCCCIIITYNIGEKLGECFFSIQNQVDEVIIVDNGSDNQTIDYILYLKKKYNITVIFNKENMGIAYALNQGANYAINKKYKWLLTMDNDSEAASDMIQVMLDTYNNLESEDKKKVVGIFPEKTEKRLKRFINEGEDYYNRDFIYVISDITSGNLLKSEIFEKAGFFEEKLFIDYVDHEFCYRIFNDGYKMIKVRNAVLLHSLGRTKEKKFLWKNIIYTNHSSLRKYYMTRNRFYTWKKYENLTEINKLDKKNFIKENIKILLLEKDKINKFKMILKGYIDYRNNKYGEKKL